MKRRDLWHKIMGILLQPAVFISSFLATLCIAAAPEYTKSVIIEDNRIRVMAPDSLPERPRLALVFSGGGSRGMAHIGVLKVFEQYQIPLDMIVGTSIGSVVGGLYASGYSPDQIAEITKRIDWHDIYKDDTQRSSLFLGQKTERDRYLVQVRFKGGNPYIPIAYTAGQKVLDILSGLFLQSQYQARSNYDNLRVPFRAVCTDLASGKQVVLKRGNLAESINASLAVPLLFTPVDIDSMLLVDGGLISNLPVDAARSEGMDVVIAVDASSRLRSKDDIDAPWKIVDQGTTIMSALATQIQEQHADLVLRPDLDDLANDDFSKPDDVIRLGEEIARQYRTRIEELIQTRPVPDKFTFKVAEIGLQNGDSALPFGIYSRMQIQPGVTVGCQEIWQDVDLFIQSGAYQKVSIFPDTIASGTRMNLDLIPFSYIQQIELKGNIQYDDEFLRRVMFNQTGQRLNASLLQNDLGRITEVYRGDGFSLMKIKVLSWNDESGRLALEIDEGRIDRIQVQGRRRTRNYVILREFKAIEGAVFNWQSVQRAIENVYATQFYERVNVDMAELGGRTNLIVKVREKPSALIRAGGKYDNDRLAQAYVEVGDESFLGLGVKAMLVNRFGMRDGHVGIKIRDDRIFTTYLTFDLQGYYNWEINPYKNAEGQSGLYRETRKGIRFQVGQQMRRLGQFIMELRQENVIDKNERGKGFSNRHNIELRTFALRAVTDKRDRVDFPTRGSYNHWAWETGSDIVLVSPEAYTKALVNLELYYTTNNFHTWRWKLFVGVGDNTLPFAENFRLGGLNSFYGLRENQKFGKQVFISSIEYRLRFPWRIHDNLLLNDAYLSMRYDFGGVWDEPALTFTSNDFFSGAGAALALDTILGPLYFGYGQTTLGEHQLYFSLGFNY